MGDRKKVLILGGSGMLGHKLLQRLPGQLSAGSEVIGTVRGSRELLEKALAGVSPGPRIVDGVDLRVPGALAQVVEQIGPDVILNCVGLTKRHLQDTPAGEAQALRVNAELPHEIAAVAKARDARVIHFSTDCVFDGVAGGYTEASVPNATDLYGRSKAQGELTENEGNCLTLRSSFIGREIQHRTELLEWFLSQKGKTVRGFRGAVYSGLATWVLADLVADLIERHPGLRGLYQVASQPLNKYELLCLMRDAFGIDVTIIPDDGFVSRRDLNAARFQKATGFVCPTWSAMMQGVANGH